MKITRIFPIKKGRGSFEKSQQYHWYMTSVKNCQIHTSNVAVTKSLIVVILTYSKWQSIEIKLFVVYFKHKVPGTL